MNGNIANGGLVVYWKGDVLFAGPDEWFLNADEEFIYYSDRRNGNHIYRKCGASAEAAESVVEEPCARVFLFEERLYYVNEEDMRLYRTHLDGSGRECLAETANGEYGVTDEGEAFVRAEARRLFVVGRNACFADAANGHVLTLERVGSSERRAFNGVCPSYINAHGGDIYYADRTAGNRIYRMDSTGARISIYGGCAEFLHVLNDSLYFISDGKWKKISLSRYGEAEEVI
ncbi:MAG: DUF5050 domain-containing protein [Clostridiales Family XIII bacterium]|jgi:hypothetical protein|nr:DUF5050 domain-containing protein [Clostridiales Family XIII bacterium]